MPTQVGAYGYRYPVPAAYSGFPQNAQYAPGPASVPSLTAASTASSSASSSSDASAAGDWAPAPTPSSTFALQPAPGPGAGTHFDVSAAVDEDLDSMGGWGRVSDPLPAPGLYTAPPDEHEQVSYAAPLGFSATGTMAPSGHEKHYQHSFSGMDWRARGAV